MNKRRHSGYTLIELLLVVAVIALIAALGVKTYRDKAQSDRINIAALNMQHVLEAGMAYYTGQGSLWPQKNNTCSATPSDQVFVKQYLPNQSNQSNLGVSLCWSGEDPTTQVDQKGKIFWVALPITAADAATAADQAKRIAARLPNAVIMDDPSNTTDKPTNTCSSTTCYVRAEVTIPSSSTTNNQAYLAGMGNCDPKAGSGAVGYVQFGSGQGPGDGTTNTNTIICKRTSLGDQFGSSVAYSSDPSLSQYEVDFTCKSGETPAIYAVPNFFTQASFASGGYIPDALYQLSAAGSSSKGDYTKNCDAITPADGVVHCTVTLLASNLGAPKSNVPAEAIGCTTKYADAKICSCPYPYPSQGGCPDKAGSIGATYMAMCVPPQTSSEMAMQQANNDSKLFW